MDGTPGELAVPNFTPPRRAQPSSLTCGIGRKVVVEHEIFAILAFEGVDDLLVLTGSERRHHERLRLAPGKKGRAVRPGQNADLARYWPNSARIASVDPPSMTMCSVCG